MIDGSASIDLSLDELRLVAGYAVACARPGLTVFERDLPGDPRPRQAIDSAQAFADGGRRVKAIRDCAWAAFRAAREARDSGHAAASHAARAAVAAASAAYLHPISRATQVKHILGSAAHVARALELAAGEDPVVAVDQMARVYDLASPSVVAVLCRYPLAPPGGGRVGELIRELDASLRQAGDH